MGKKRGTKRSPQTPTPSHTSISLRQEATGRIQTQGINFRDPKFLRLQHLKNISLWASREALVPSSLAAFYGRRYAAAADALGVPPDPELIHCERCETILEPGFNCTVRIEKNRAKSRGRRKKRKRVTKNNVVYKCHFCSHHNLMGGTPIGYLKEICPSKSKQKPPAESKPSKSIPEKSVSLENVSGIKIETVKIDEIALSTESKPSELIPEKSVSLENVSGIRVEPVKVDELASPPDASRDTSFLNSPATPLVTNGASLLDAKRRKRKRNRSGSKKPEESEDSSAAKDGEGTVNASNRRKRKSWMSLKEITESNEHASTADVANLTIPFIM